MTSFVFCGLKLKMGYCLTFDLTSGKPQIPAIEKIEDYAQNSGLSPRNCRETVLLERLTNKTVTLQQQRLYLQ